ncbi:RNase adapter RapZ [Rhodovulum sp. DZ06]|uniref:RNase adapter RapZ n=1 Tax=Rhodovulum sp. DZ06 TaxID=3425126 RepID=UPI003D352FAB
MTDTPDAQAAEDGDAPTRIVLVTGLSGAGNSTAIRVLEDLGHEAIDNLPLSFIARLASGEAAPEPGAPPRPLALGVDVRTRGFTPDAFRARLRAMRADPGLDVRMVFLDCAPDTLVDRFKTTRRRHPLGAEGGIEGGITLERELLAPLRERADIVIDTTALSPHDLKARLAAFIAEEGGPQAELAISVQSFSFKRGAPREADSVFDCRFLRNPHWQAELRPMDGRDAPVREHVEGDPLYAPFLDRVAELTMMLLPAYRREGKAYFCIALGCSGGRHRSVAAAEELAARLRTEGWRAALRHRELDAGSG